MLIWFLAVNVVILNAIVFTPLITRYLDERKFHKEMLEWRKNHVIERADPGVNQSRNSAYEIRSNKVLTLEEIEGIEKAIAEAALESEGLGVKKDFEDDDDTGSSGNGGYTN